MRVGANARVCAKLCRAMSVHPFFLCVLLCPASACWAQATDAGAPGAPGTQRSDLWNSIEAQYRAPSAMQQAAQRRLSAEERALLREQVRGGYVAGMAHMAPVAPVVPVAVPAPVPVQAPARVD